jgi:7-cyano-7-deazaguanine synthase
MKNEKAVILVSGGMDSCTTAAIAAENYELAFLHLNYGQRTAKRELKAFNDIADYYEIRERLVVDVKYFTQIGGSSLTDYNLKIEAADLERRNIPASYVPFRNANILAIATSWAEVIGAAKIFIGAVQDDSSGYPDCREVFFLAFNEVIRFGAKPETKIKIEAPLLHLKKDAIVQKAIEMKAPIELSWSCYQKEEQACGVCDSCALRLRGFQRAGREDPVSYEVKPKYV